MKARVLLVLGTRPEAIERAPSWLCEEQCESQFDHNDLQSTGCTDCGALYRAFPDTAPG